MIMRLTLVVEMRGVVIMPVIMRVIMPMPMMMMATHSKHSEQINAQAQTADQQELVRVHRRRIEAIYR